jgi:hypothetical protein
VNGSVSQRRSQTPCANDGEGWNGEVWRGRFTNPVIDVIALLQLRFRLSYDGGALSITLGTPCHIGCEYLNSMRGSRWPLINATSGVVRPISKKRLSASCRRS